MNPLTRPNPVEAILAEQGIQITAPRNPALYEAHKQVCLGNLKRQEMLEQIWSGKRR